MAPVAFAFRWKGIVPGLAILAVASMTVAFSLISPFSSLAYQVGKSQEDKREFLSDYSEPDPYLVRIAYTMNYVQTSAAENDIVFLGDSTCVHGINVASFEESTSLHAFNIASVDWIGWKGYILTLQQYLAHHSKPKIVILCIAPYAFFDRGILPYEDKFSWSFGSGSEEERPRHQSSLLYYRAEGVRVLCNNFNDLIYATVNNNFKAIHFDIDAQKYKELNTDQKGSMGLKKVTDQAWYVFPTLVSQPCRVQMDRLCAICSSNDVRILIRIMPFRSGTITKSLEPVQSYLNEVKSAWNNVIISEPWTLNYGSEYFYDNVHLNTNGADQISKHLGNEVNRLLGTPSK